MRSSTGRICSGTTSWRPIAQIARRRSPRSSKTGQLPNASCAQIADGLGRLDLALDDRRREHQRVGVQAEDALAARGAHAQHDRLADAQVVDALRHLAGDERVERRGHAARHEQRPTGDALGRLGELGEQAEVLGGGDDRAVAGEADADPDDARRARSADAASRNAGSASGIMPSRRSPTSTIATTLNVRPARAAAASSAATTSSSLTSATSVSATVSSARAGVGERSSQNGPATPAWRMRATFSSRDSPSAETPPASIARAISGVPQVTFVTPTMSTPGSADATVRALSSILPRSMVRVAMSSMWTSVSYRPQLARMSATTASGGKCVESAPHAASR